jgi:A118 family predicted phage portal protein
MPLPDGGAAPWPPKEYQSVINRMTIWEAWYCGDPDALSAVYTGQVAGGDPGDTGFFASQPGGWGHRINRAFQRWFWGRPTTAGQPRTKLHIPLASDIATTSAALLFSEPPKLLVPGEDDDTGPSRTQKRLDDLSDDGLHATLLEAAEMAAALGGVYLRICWDRDNADAPWLSPVSADQAVPEWQWGRLSAVTFWRILPADGNRVLRHLERHEPGFISHALYDGTADQLGRRVPLTEHPATADLAGALGQSGDTITTGIKQLTAVYVPNMRPNRLWRGTPAAAPLGRPDIAGAEPLLDALDETYTSWMRDIRLAKSRIIVPASMLESEGPGKGSSWDADREVFSPLQIVDRGDAQLTLNQFAIRVTEHKETAQDLTEQILRSAGYSSQTFGEMGQAAVTATEVVARERQSFTTRNRKITYWRPALVEAMQVLLAIDQAVYRSGVDVVEPLIEWADSVSEDPQTIATTASLLRQAEAASTETLVRLVHPDWDDARVQDEVADIAGETGRAVEDPTMLGAGGRGLPGGPVLPPEEVPPAPPGQQPPQI